MDLFVLYDKARQISRMRHDRGVESSWGEVLSDAAASARAGDLDVELALDVMIRREDRLAAPLVGRPE